MKILLTDTKSGNIYLYIPELAYYHPQHKDVIYIVRNVQVSFGDIIKSYCVTYKAAICVILNPTR